MRKRKNTGKLLSILLCLMMVLGMLPITAQAEEWGKVPGSSDTNTYEKADIKVEISVVKHVQQTGTETPPAETFEFEVEDTARDEKHPLSYYGIGVEELKLSTNGVGDVEKTFSFNVPWTNDYADYHWDAVPKSGTDTVAWYSKTFLLREKNDGKPGWKYSNAEYALTFWYDIEHGTMDLNIHVPGNDAYYTKAEFTNTYNGTSYELPFTKTVKLGGNTAPGKTDFTIAVCDVGAHDLSYYPDVTYKVVITTTGAGSYDGKLVISGPAEKVSEFVSEGFFVREVKGSLSGWKYSDAVWHVMPEYQVEIGVPPMQIYPTKLEKTPNGEFYVDGRTPVGKMTFENIYTRNTSSHTTTDEKPISSPKTFDAGVALYGVSALLSLTGTALVIKRKNG